jgi:D-alanyl-D-alanine dipeptidase
MKFNSYFLSILTLLILISCKSTESSFVKSRKTLSNNYLTGNSIAIYDGINDTTFVNLKDFSSDFVFDMKYATDDNFLKSKVYDCQRSSSNISKLFTRF